MGGWHSSRWTCDDERQRARTGRRNAAGGCRSAMTATEPSAALYRVGGCPTFAYAFPGGTLQSASAGDLDRGAARRPGRGLLRATRAAEAGLRWATERRRLASWGGSPPPSRAGWHPTSPPSFPASGSPRSPSMPPGEEPGGGTPAPARSLRPLLRCPRDPPARTADPLGLPGLLSPDRPRPRSHPDPGRAARAGAPPGRCLQQRGPARGRADDRDRRDRGRAAGLRRGAGGQALHPRRGPGRGAPRAARGVGPGDTGDRRRARPGRAPVRREHRLEGIEQVTRQLTIAAVQVKGVPQIAVEEALWMAAADSRRLEA